MATNIVEHSGEEETHTTKTSSPSKLSHSMARFLGLESTESSNKPHKQIPEPNRPAATSNTPSSSSNAPSRNPRSTPPSTSFHAPPSASLPALPVSPTTPISLRRGSRREPDEERRGSPLFGFGRPKSANLTSSRSPSLSGSPTPRHVTLRTEDDDDSPVLTIRRESEPFNQRVSGLGVDLFSLPRESNDGDILELGETDEESEIAVEDDSDDELDPRPKYSPRQGKAYALLGLPSPPTLTTTPTPTPAARRPPMARSPSVPAPPPPSSTLPERSIPAFPCTQTDLVSFVHASAEIRVYAHLTTAFRRKKWRPRWIILTLSPNSSSATLHSFKHRLGTSSKDSKDEPETGRLELVGNTEIYVPVEQMGEKYVLNVTGTTSIMEGTKRLDVMSNILLSFVDIESFKYWMTLLKTTVVELNDEKHSTLTIGHRKMSDALSPRSTNRDSLSASESPSLSFDSRTDTSTIGFDGNLEKSWEDNQQPLLPATTRESFFSLPRRIAPIPPHSRNRSTEISNSPVIPLATNHAPPVLAPPTTALPLTPPHSGSLYGSFPSPPARQNRPSSAFAHASNPTSNPMEDFDPGVMSGSASTYSRASIRSLPVPLSARSSMSNRKRTKGPPSMPPPSSDLPFLPPVPPSVVRSASADSMMLSRSASGRIGSHSLPSAPPTGALPPPPPPPPMSGLPSLPSGALPLPISLSSRRLIKKPSRIAVAGQ